MCGRRTSGGSQQAALHKLQSALTFHVMLCCAVNMLAGQRAHHEGEVGAQARAGQAAHCTQEGGRAGGVSAGRSEAVGRAALSSAGQPKARCKTFLLRGRQVEICKPRPSSHRQRRGERSAPDSRKEKM